MAAIPTSAPASWSLRLRALVARTDRVTATDRTAARVALVVGVVFVIACTPKFFAFGWERDAFRRFELPLPGAMVLLAGVLELVGGVLLVLRRGVVPACVVLSAVMLVAFVSGGIVAGDVLPSLTLAPALLVAMLWLLARVLRGRV